MLNTTVSCNLRKSEANLFPDNMQEEFLQLQRENEMLKRVNKGLRNRLDLVLRRAIEMRKMHH